MRQTEMLRLRSAHLFGIRRGRWSCGTRFGGQAMGMGDELGQIKEGFLADLLLVDGDPLKDLGSWWTRTSPRHHEGWRLYKDIAKTPRRKKGSLERLASSLDLPPLRERQRQAAVLSSRFSTCRSRSWAKRENSQISRRGRSPIWSRQKATSSSDWRLPAGHGGGRNLASAAMSRERRRLRHVGMAEQRQLDLGGIRS